MDLEKGTSVLQFKDRVTAFSHSEAAPSLI